MDTQSNFITAFRQRLEKKQISTESIATMVEILTSIITFADIDSPTDQKILDKLGKACENNAALLSLIHQQARDLDALKRITLNLTSSLDLEVVLDQVAQEAMRLVKDAAEVRIFLFQDQKLVFGASLNSDGSKDHGSKEPHFNGLIDHITKIREMIVVEDITTHPIFQDSDLNISGSIIGFPLLIGDRLIGIMKLVRSQPGEFNQSEIRLLKLLADEASIAIVNARLHNAVSLQAHFDMLTGLPNRLALEERLEAEFSSALQKNIVFSVIMIDIDDLKHVNDMYGHEGGDELLRQVACFLRENLRASDFIARFGGDEFTLLLPATNLEQTLVVIDKLFKHLTELVIPLPGGKTSSVGFSGGIAIYPDHAGIPSELMRVADEALYRAKRTNPGGFQVGVNSNA